MPTSPEICQWHVGYAIGKVMFELTELDAWVVFTDLVALVVGEKHVGGQTALWHVGVWNASADHRGRGIARQ